MSEELAKRATWSASGQAELKSLVKIWVLKTMPKPSPFSWLYLSVSSLTKHLYFLSWKQIINLDVNKREETLTSGTKREKPNLINKRTCSMIKIAASPGSTFHFPSSSYSQAKRAQLVQIDITVRNCKNQGCPQISEIYIIHSVASGVKEFHLNDEALLYV